ncbi:MAG: hypothetical protein M5U12_10205 [Verrucomicrobia bacterium]|nr:hypothetical protein [Verrucomicrobiota bacterium]
MHTLCRRWGGSFSVLLATGLGILHAHEDGAPHAHADEVPLAATPLPVVVEVSGPVPPPQPLTGTPPARPARASGALPPLPTCCRCPNRPEPT